MQGGFYFTPVLSAQRSAQLCETSPLQIYHTNLDTPTIGGRGEHRSPVFVRPHGMYKFKPHNSPKRDVEGAVPYNYALLCHAAKSLRSLRILPPIRGHKKAVQSFHSDTTLFYPLVCFSSIAYLHRLVGLRLLRLCPFLVSEVEQEIYSAMGFAP